MTKGGGGGVSPTPAGKIVDDDRRPAPDPVLTVSKPTPSKGTPATTDAEHICSTSISHSATYLSFNFATEGKGSYCLDSDYEAASFNRHDPRGRPILVLHRRHRATGDLEDEGDGEELFLHLVPPFGSSSAISRRVVYDCPYPR